MLSLISVAALAVTPGDVEDYAARLEARLARRVPDHTFHILTHGPFVIIGDESRRQVERRRRTIAWARARLTEDFFAREPDHIIEVWLFDGERSYRRFARELFGDVPDTPYGYYSSADRALIMNIATGGGTLVHELVHPYLEADFPTAPSWLDEGLASLYEHAAERDGDIVGKLNWRLRGLRDAIARGELPELVAMTSTSSAAFYSSDTGYAHARYLLYYLQERGLLRDFYARFRARHALDPTGVKTLRAVLGERDLGAFHRRWMRWVLDLEYRS